MNLTEFLLARIAEDEVEASAATGDRFWVKRGSASANHIWRWQPERVLAECAAKRRIVASVVRAPNPTAAYELEPMMRFLAEPYADHPDYDPEWKPN